MKKFFAALLTAAFVGVSATALAANSFSDVPAMHWAYKSVTRMADAGILIPSANGKYEGDRNVTRSEMAQMSANLLKKLSPNSAADADKLVKTWSKDGNKDITRYDIAIMLADVYAKVNNGTLPAAPQAFSDVPKKHAASNAINLMAATEVMEGYGDGTFRGDRTMTRYEAALLLSNLYGRLSK